MNRRNFLANSAVALAGASLPSQLFAADSKPKHILLRSSWQTVNIGDIGHTPGVLALLEQHLPDAEVRLWPSSVKDGVEEMLLKRFPKLKIVNGTDVLTAFEECDFLLHGSGPSLVASADVTKWREKTGKPYGVFGITHGTTTSSAVENLSKARFVFFRDSISLQFAKDHEVKCPIMEVGQDGAFAVDVRNDAAAEKFLTEHNLEAGNFLCCIPRLRNTPYWKIKPGVPFDEKKHARNEAMKEHDLAPLRDAVTAVIRETKMKILLCPEDASQMAVGKDNIYDKLPNDVKDRVVWRENYWLTDEAVSTYRRSVGLFGCEMHSPIMCIGNGIPAIVCRWTEQTSKGFMWRDIGLGDWLFDFDKDNEIPKLLPAVLAMAKDPAAAKAKATKARDYVRNRLREMCETLRANL